MSDYVYEFKKKRNKNIDLVLKFEQLKAIESSSFIHCSDVFKNQFTISII